MALAPTSMLFQTQPHRPDDPGIKPVDFEELWTTALKHAQDAATMPEDFRGSYLAGLAARMGQELITKQKDYFDSGDYELAGKLAEIMSAIPTEAEAIFADLVEGEQERATLGISITDADHKTKIAALAALIKNTRDNLAAAKGGSTVSAKDIISI